MRNLYDILGVSKRASTSDIKAAFRTQARDKHPDANNGAKKAEDAFKELNRAYAILSDPDQRSLYDRGEIDETGATVRTRRQSRSSPFEEFIKRRKNQTKSDGRTIKIHGSDVTYSLKINFMEAIHGSTKHVSMTNGKRLKVNIPPGTRHEQTLRLRNKGITKTSGQRGDQLVRLQIMLPNKGDPDLTEFVRSWKAGADHKARKPLSSDKPDKK